jgi:Zn-dependent peptidase ImmA (M78 family)
MAKVVPFISDEGIERDAAMLLADYARTRGVTIVAPIPIEDIVEKHLKIGVEFDDMHRRLEVPRSGLGLSPSILGAIFLADARIVIDESLDPDATPAMEGRFRFTLAHESGHWRLHRDLFGNNRAQGTLFETDAEPSVICRDIPKNQQRPREEVQADLYASCLLMPRKMVMEAWDGRFPDRKPRVLKPRVQVAHPYVEIARSDQWAGRDERDRMDAELDAFARPFAEHFLVSPMAMRIRLEKLGLLHRELPHQRFLTRQA